MTRLDTTQPEWTADDAAWAGVEALLLRERERLQRLHGRAIMRADGAPEPYRSHHQARARRHLALLRALEATADAIAKGWRP